MILSEGWKAWEAFGGWWDDVGYVLKSSFLNSSLSPRLVLSAVITYCNQTMDKNQRSVQFCFVFLKFSLIMFQLNSGYMTVLRTYAHANV